MHDASPVEVRVLGSVKQPLGNPSALGLLGLIVVTAVASTQKLGWTSGVAAIVPWAICLGACAQLLAGVLDFKHDNSFGATTFCGFGFFWLAVAMSWMTQLGMFGAKAAETFSAPQLGVAFLAYAAFSIVLTLAAMGSNKALFLDFLFIDLLLLGLAVTVLTGSHLAHKLAAWAELLTSVCSFYLLAANVLNTHYKRVVVPVGKPFGPWIAPTLPSIVPLPSAPAIALSDAE